MTGCSAMNAAADVAARDLLDADDGRAAAAAPAVRQACSRAAGSDPVGEVGLGGLVVGRAGPAGIAAAKNRVS